MDTPYLSAANFTFRLFASAGIVPVRATIRKETA
jgi:hypothetical protein